MTDVERLRGQVLDRYVSVHAFCRAHPELKRATVYLVLAGKYPGKWSAQAEKIRAALGEGTPEETPFLPGVTRESLTENLQDIRCAHCRRLDRRDCTACRELTEREGKVLFVRLFQGR